MRFSVAALKAVDGRHLRAMTAHKDYTTCFQNVDKLESTGTTPENLDCNCEKLPLFQAQHETFGKATIAQMNIGSRIDPLMYRAIYVVHGLRHGSMSEWVLV